MQVKLTKLDDIERRFPTPFQVREIKHRPRRENWCRQLSDAMKFAVIPRGTGWYVDNDERFQVDAPFVLTKWPDQYVEYGPDESDEEWEELSIIYPPEVADEFIKIGLARRDHPVWPINDFPAVHRKLNELMKLLENPTEPGAVDRIDLLCQGLIMETCLGNKTKTLSNADRQILSVKDYVDQHFCDAVKVSELAEQYGWSAATFHRHWNRVVGSSPVRYISQLRMEEACRLLVETDLPVGEIAARVGYDDVLYFSRKFSKHAAMPATEYRNTYQNR